jgi:hypothetical protein
MITRRTSNLLAAAALLAALWSAVELPPLHAQWGHPKTAGVPKKADGKPNLSAPAPKTTDGKPDLSGMWEMKKDKPCPPEGCADQQVGYQFFDIGYGLPGGLPYQPWAADLVKTRMEQNGKEDPTSRCLPAGIVKLHTWGYPRKIVQIPGLLIILNPRDTAYRQIFTDGRPLPAEVDLPSFDGFSSGRWQGDTLVVETTGFPDGIWLDRNGNPLTSAAKIIEKFHRVNYGTLEIEITVNDPKAYTKPWTTKLTQVIVLDQELVDYICLENEKDAPNLVGK